MSLISALKKKEPFDKIVELYNDYDKNYVDFQGKNALFYAGYDEKIMEFLIKKGVNVQQVNIYGMNALFYCTENPKALKLLLDNGVNVNQRDYLFRNCLYHTKSEESIRVLSENGLILGYKELFFIFITMCYYPESVALMLLNNLSEEDFIYLLQCSQDRTFLFYINKERFRLAMKEFGIPLSDDTESIVDLDEKSVLSILTHQKALDKYIETVQNMKRDCNVCKKTVMDNFYISTCCPRSSGIHAKCFSKDLNCLSCKKNNSPYLFVPKIEKHQV